MADILSIAVSGLKAQQTALSVTGNNISNAGTEGYSRQDVSFTQGNSQYLSGNWMGSGVSLDSVSRIYDQFLTEQVWEDTTDHAYYETLSSYAGRVDSLLADSTTGIQPGLESMFEAMQAVVDDPSSISTREVLITEASALTDRFAVVTDQLNSLNLVLNGQMTVLADEVSSLAESIAELNEEIAFATGTAQGDQPGSLLDQRDRLITRLSTLVDVKVSEQGASQINVYIGDGMPLVVGSDANTLFAGKGEIDSNRFTFFMENADRTREVGESVTGGTLGASLSFRNDILDATRNSLGKLALVVSEQFNRQQGLGLDYNGQVGEDFFSNINDRDAMYQRVIGDDNNANPDDRVAGVRITDAGQLSTSDFTLEFNGPSDYNYRLIDNDSGEIVRKGAISGEFPEAIDIAGAEIVLESGSFQQGDRFLIMPTRNEASRMEVDLTLAEQIALATPIVTAADYGNQGSAQITQGSVSNLDTFAFNDDKQLDPPLLIRFTSATRYEVLNNSDPANPVPLQPPISNQPYVAGISNVINLGSDTQQVTTSLTDRLPLRPTYQPEPPAADVTPGNGFSAQSYTISQVNPATGAVTRYADLNIDSNASARQIAAAMNEYPGISASAQTRMQLTGFRSDEGGFIDTGISLNGVELTDTLTSGQAKYAEGYPQTVPEPVTADFIAERINANFDFRDAGIRASSDGETVTITAVNGEDLTLEVSGDPGDGVAVSNGEDIRLESIGAATFKRLNEYEGYDFSEGGPYQYAFDTPDQGRFEFTLDEHYESAEAMLQGIRDAIETSGYSSTGDLDIAINARGEISFQPRMEVNGSGIHGSNKLTLGGQLTVVVDDGTELASAGRVNNLFPDEMMFDSGYMGIEVAIAGAAAAGDRFTIGNNQDAVTDSRNGAAMLALQSSDTVNGTSTFSEAYSTLVEQVGSVTSRAQNSYESAQVLLDASQAAVASVSGVNLDEEAAALIQYELAYNANAQVIQVARDMFDTLISTVG